MCGKQAHRHMCGATEPTGNIAETGCTAHAENARIYIGPPVPKIEPAVKTLTSRAQGLQGERALPQTALPD